jgi:hypothetical protein
MFDFIKEKAGSDEKKLEAVNRQIENAMTNLVHLTNGRLPANERSSIFVQKPYAAVSGELKIL